MKLIGVGAVALASCAGGGGHAAPVPAPVRQCVGHVVTAAPDGALGCDLVPPQRLDLVFEGADTRADARVSADAYGCVRVAYDGARRAWKGIRCDY